MPTPRKLYPAHEVLIKILKNRAIFIKAFNDNGLNINSWQVMTLLSHMISHVHIQENEQRNVINALFDLWDKTLTEKNMPVQAFRKFVLKQLPHPNKQQRRDKYSDVSAHLYLQKIIIGDNNYKKELKKICLTGKNYNIAIKFALIFLSRMILPFKEEGKIDYFNNIIIILKKQKKFHQAIFTAINNQQL